MVIPCARKVQRTNKGTPSRVTSTEEFPTFFLINKKIAAENVVNATPALKRWLKDEQENRISQKGYPKDCLLPLRSTTCSCIPLAYSGGVIYVRYLPVSGICDIHA